MRLTEPQPWYANPIIIALLSMLLAAILLLILSILTLLLTGPADEQLAWHAAGMQQVPWI